MVRRYCCCMLHPPHVRVDDVGSCATTDGEVHLLHTLLSFVAVCFYWSAMQQYLEIHVNDTDVKVHTIRTFSETYP